MAEATDTPPPPPKLSRYRTLRGKNVPESRRYVAPPLPPPPPPSDQEAAANHGHSHGSNALPPQRTTILPHASSEAPASSLTAPPQPPPSALPSGGRNGVTSPFRETHSGAVRPPVRGSPAHPPVSSLRSLESAVSSADADGAAAFLAAPVDRRRQQRPPPLRPTLPDHSQQQSPLQETRREPDAAAPLLPTQILVPLPSARHGGQAMGGGVVASAETGLRSYAGGAGVLRHGASDEDVAQMDVDVERILAEQKRKDLERLQAQLANHQPAVSSPKSPAREKFAFLTRRRGLSSAVSSSSSSSPLTSPNPATTSPTEPLAGKFASPANPVSLASKSSSAAPRPATGYANGSPNRTPSASDPPLPVAAPFEPKPAPFMDAPSSAPGGGASRQVSVRCRQFSAKITVFVDTTVADLLQSCADAFPCPIDAGTSALLESYTRLGLERRLRRYERVRDIMDSWDNEADNALVVLPAPDADSAGTSAVAEPVTRSKKGSKDAPNGTGSGIGIGRNGDANDLHVSSVLRSRSSPPSGFKFLQMYHSQKPGRWNKRFVTLVEGTGQVVATKKADESRLAFLFNSDGGGSGGGGGGGSGGGGSSGVSSNANSDVQNLCHLSDYDIYTPTEAHMRKHLKPPKMFCFAIKSQQRTTVFVNTDNYVHFFSIEDPVQARMFYDRVFAWRSWYLVNQKLSVPLRGVAPAAAKKKQHQQHQHQQLVQAPQSQKATTMPPSSSSSAKQHALQRSYSRKSTTSGNAPVSRSANNPSNRISVAESLFGNVGNFDPTLSLGLYAKPEADGGQSATKVGAPHTANEKDGDTFSSNGLLGSKYDERKKVEAENQRETGQRVSATAVDSREGPFTGGSSLLSRNVAPSTATAAPAVSSGRQEPTTPWFPSASEHTARQRSRSVRETTSSSRPTSSSDIPLALQFPQLLQQQLLLQKQQQLQQQQLQQSGRHPNHSVRRANTHTSSSSSSQPPHPSMPTPLIDLTPKFQEAPQWSKEGRGHGVRPPPGAAHLVDLATSRSGPGGGGSTGGSGASGRNSLVDEQPPSRAMLMRRDEPPPHSAAPHSSVRRTQTMTSASAAAAVGLSRSHRTVHHTPPVPLLARTTPGSATSRDDVGSSRERSGTLTRK